MAAIFLRKDQFCGYTVNPLHEIVWFLSVHSSFRFTNMLGECLVMRARFVAWDNPVWSWWEWTDLGVKFSWFCSVCAKKKTKTFCRRTTVFFSFYTPTPSFNLSQHTFPSFSSCQDHNPVLLIQFPHQRSQQHITISLCRRFRLIPTEASALRHLNLSQWQNLI